MPAQAKGPLTMTVEAGYGGFHRPETRVPVTVVIRSTRAVEGDLEVIVDRWSQRSVQTFSFEITGGGRKRFDMLVPSPVLENNDILVRVKDGEEVLARQRVVLTIPTDVLVGFLGAEPPASIGSVDLVPTGKRPLAFRVDEERASLGVPALEPLSHLAVDLGASRKLAPAIVAALTGWVSAGGRLILLGAGPVAGPEWLPSAWRIEPTTTITSRPAGIGEIVAVPINGPVASSDATVWKQVLRPVLSEPTEGFSGEQGAAFELANRLTRPSRGRLDLDLFFLFVLLYVVLVAPVNYLILKKRGRRELAWITIPLLATIFSGMAYGFARTDPDIRRLNQASVSLLTDGSAVTSQLVALGAAARSDVRVYFPSKYAHPVSSVGGGGVQKVRKVTVSGKGTIVEMETAPFSVSAAIGGGERVDGYLDAQLVWDGDGFFGTVTNRTRYRLDEVEIAVGPDAAPVGAIRPGQSVEVALVPSAGLDSFPDERIVGEGGMAPGMIVDDGTGQRSVGDLLRRLLVEELPIDRGVVLVSGVARAQGPSVEVTGVPGRTVKTSLVASIATVGLGPGAKRLPPSASSWWLAGFERGAGGDHGGCMSPFCADPGVLTLTNFKEAVFGSVLLPGVDPARLRNGKIVVGTNLGVLRGDGGRGEGAIDAPAIKRRIVPVPVPMPPDGQVGGESAPVQTDEPVPVPAEAGAYRFLYWDWAKAGWVEGELWPGGKDLVPASAVSPLGEMYVKVIAPFESGLEISVAGIEWEVS